MLRPPNDLAKNHRPKLIRALFTGLLLLLLALPVSGETLSGEAQVKPWSGYWWPLQKGELVRGYEGHPSPIEKYDLYTYGHYPNNATLAAASQWYDPEVPYWYGFCNGWANASILEPIDIVPAAAQGVFLAVGDKKGLLSAYHSKDLTISENCRTSPAPFHRYLLAYLGENGQAVVANLDNFGEFWSYPIYKYEMVIARGTAYDHVLCTITHADDQGFSPDFEGTVAVEKSYEYRLYKDNEGSYIGGNSSDSGEWLGASVEDHPVLVWVPIGLRPERNFIDYEIISAMAMTYDDELEGKDLVPGHHQLIVYPDDEDIFELQPQIGELITLRVAFDRQSTFGETAHLVLRRNGAIVSDETVGYNMQPLEISSATGKDQYQLSLSADAGNFRAVFVHLYADYKTTNEHWFYGFPSTLFWLGFAALPTAESSLFLEVVGEQGLPANTGVKWDQSPAEKRCLNLLATTFTQDYFIDNQPLAVKVGSTTPTVSLVFSGNNQFLWGTPQCQPLTARKVIIPWLTHWFNRDENGELFLANHNPADLNLTLSYYYNDGNFHSTKELRLASEEISLYGGTIDYPGAVSLNGWALAEADKEGLDGAVLRTQGSLKKDQLPLLGLGNEWLVPHLAVGSGWQTTISLYNPNAQPAEVSLLCYHGQPDAEIYAITLAAFSRSVIEIDGDLWDIDNSVINSAWLEVRSNREISGFFSYHYSEDSVASMPFIDTFTDATRWLPHVVCDDNWWTGLAFVNLGSEIKTITLAALSAAGETLENREIELAGREKFTGLADNFFNAETKSQLVAVRLEQASGVAALGVYGTFSGASRITGFNW